MLGEKAWYFCERGLLDLENAAQRVTLAADAPLVAEALQAPRFDVLPDRLECVRALHEEDTVRGR